MRRDLAIAAALLLGACKSPQAQLSVSFSSAGDGGCAAQTQVGCVNYLQFTVAEVSGSATSFATNCVKVDRPLGSLCDVAALAQGQDLFQLPPDTTLTIKLEGLRAFPATSCEAQDSCDPRYIFSGTSQQVRLGDLVGGSLDIPLAMNRPCVPEDFFFITQGARGGACLPGDRCASDLSCVSGLCASSADAGTTPCEDLCGSPEMVVCDGIPGGCLCTSPESQ